MRWEARHSSVGSFAVWLIALGYTSLRQFQYRALSSLVLRSDSVHTKTSMFVSCSLCQPLHDCISPFRDSLTSISAQTLLSHLPPGWFLLNPAVVVITRLRLKTSYANTSACSGSYLLGTEVTKRSAYPPAAVPESRTDVYLQLHSDTHAIFAQRRGSSWIADRGMKCTPLRTSLQPQYSSSKLFARSPTGSRPYSQRTK